MDRPDDDFLDKCLTVCIMLQMFCIWDGTGKAYLSDRYPDLTNRDGLVGMPCLDYPMRLASEWCGVVVTPKGIRK